MLDNKKDKKNIKKKLIGGYSSAGLEYLTYIQRVTGSNPVIPTMDMRAK